MFRECIEGLTIPWVWRQPGLLARNSHRVLSHPRIPRRHSNFLTRKTANRQFSETDPFCEASGSSYPSPISSNCQTAIAATSHRDTSSIWSITPAAAQRPKDHCRTFSHVLTPSTNYEIPPQALINLIVGIIASKISPTQSRMLCEEREDYRPWRGHQPRIRRTGPAGDKVDKGRFR